MTIDHIKTTGHEELRAQHPIGATVVGREIFYNGQGGDNVSEAERLRKMAELKADEVSLELIEPKAGQIIVDAGAGDSPSLGEAVVARGARYIPFDQRADAVEALRRAGHTEAFRASITNIDREPIADTVHARFVFGWLADPQQREAALCEMLRTVKPGGRVIILDYDWKSIEGPQELKDAAGLAMGILGELGFDSTYGGTLGEDIRRRVSAISADPEVAVEYGRASQESSFDGRLQDCLAIFEQTAASINHNLETLGMDERKVALDNALAKLKEATKENPDTPVKLADIVAQELHVTQPLPRREQASAQESGSYHFNEGVDYRRIIDLPDGRTAVEVVSPEMILHVRRLQGGAYADDSLVRRDVLEDKAGSRGTLPESIDPTEQVARSHYFTVVNGDGLPLSCVRYIAPDSDKGLVSLPTAERLSEPSRKKLEESCPQENIIEISAFARDFQHGTFPDVIDAVLAMAVDVRDKGYELGIMGLQASKARPVMAVFGEQNFHEIEEPHLITLDGVNGSARFRTFCVEAQPFLGNVRDHAQSKVRADTNGNATLFQSIVETTQNI